ncbi:XrtA-associated tyrosine autokinase [Pelagibius marinus]|uniref:XrtA-associated tyrosine autokinase n=1 Tax=Pelagibius marinus TaxID=2762760 RepID=UPI00187259B8|nr:XrtA-associated tyrosine autokinase [Pelagibius marinus]
MADETRGSNGKRDLEARSASLIERAAAKLAAEGASGQRKKAAPGADLSPKAALQIDDAAKKQAAEGEQGRRRRRSKLVTIATEGLAKRGILTPGVERSRTVEEFRLIKRLVLSQRWEIQGRPGNTIIVTSALPTEGKTTTAINLAMSITAEEDLRAVLVDADFIKPDALRQLGISARKGLVDVLRDPSMDIGEVMLRTNIEKLSLIPAGQLDNRCTELLASARMDAIIKELSNRYEDRILIFDSPPILATTESVVLTAHMGQVVFVVQAGRTKRESVSSALELIGERPNLGLILNRTTGGFGKTGFGSYYDAYYYYGYGAKKELDGQSAA